MSNPIQPPEGPQSPYNPQPNHEQPNNYAFDPSTGPMHNQNNSGYTGTPNGSPYPPNGYNPYGGYRYTNPGQMPQNTPNTGLGTAIASLAVSICGVVFFCLGIYWIQFLVLSTLLGIVGIVLAAISKRAGYKGTLRTAGFVTSIVVLAVSGVCLVSCIGCASFTKYSL